MNCFLRVLGLLLFVAFSGGAFGQSTSRSVDWDRLTPEQKQVLKHRFELWKRMPEDQKQVMKRRHEALVEMKSQLGGDGAGAGPRDDAGLRKLLERKRRQILEGGRFDREEIEAVATDDIVEAARARALERIARMESEGIVDPEHAARLRELAPPKLGRELRKLEKKRFLSRPPRPFLDLPKEERERISRLPPDEFLREIKRVVPPPERPPQGGKPEAKGGPRPPDRPRVPQDPRFLAAKRWVDENLSEQEREAIRAAEPFERRNVIRKFLRARAKQALRERGEDAASFEEIELLPAFEREMRWIQLIDPSFEPPAPPPPGKGPGGRFRDR